MKRFQRIFTILARLSLIACCVMLTALLVTHFYHRCWATIRWTEVPFGNNGSQFTSQVSYFGVESHRIFWGSSNESHSFDHGPEGSSLRQFYSAIAAAGTVQKVSVARPADIIAADHPDIWFGFAAGGGATASSHSSAIPLLLLTIIFGVEVVVCLIVRRALHYAEREDRRPGHCASCGYNLTANASGVCPECGTAIAATR